MEALELSPEPYPIDNENNLSPDANRSHDSNEEQREENTRIRSTSNQNDRNNLAGPSTVICHNFRKICNLPKLNRMIFYRVGPAHKEAPVVMKKLLSDRSELRGKLIQSNRIRTMTVKTMKTTLFGTS